MKKRPKISIILKHFSKVENDISKCAYKAATETLANAYEKSLEINFAKGIVMFYEYRATILLETYENHEALPYLILLIKKSSKNDHKKLSIYYLKLGILLSRLYDFDKSTIYLQKSIEENLKQYDKNIAQLIFSYLAMVENAFRENKMNAVIKNIQLAKKELNLLNKNEDAYHFSLFYISIFETRVLLKQNEPIKAKNLFKQLNQEFASFNKKEIARYKELELDFLILENTNFKEILSKAKQLLKISVQLENKNLRIRLLKILKTYYTKRENYEIANDYASRLLNLIKEENDKKIPVLHNKSIELTKKIKTIEEIEKEDAEEYEFYFKKDIKKSQNYQFNFFNSDYNDKISVSTLFKPAKTISGDYIGTFPIGEDKNIYLFIMADTVGKGITASYFSFMLNGIIQAIIYNAIIFDIKNLITDINTILAETFNADGFVSLWAGLVNLNDNTLESVNAGHNPVFMINKNNKVTELNKGCTILGSFSDLPFIEIETIDISKGTSIIAYTDGVTETENNIGLPYEENFIHFINEYTKNRKENFIERLEEDLNNFKDDTLDQDDISCIKIDIN